VTRGPQGRSDSADLDSPTEQRGLGGLLTTEVERVRLGRHQGRVLHGRVERRVLRVAAGGRWRFALTIGRARAVAVEVERAGERDVVAVPPVSDPWLAMLRRTLLLWGGSLLLVAAVNRMRSSRGGSRPASGVPDTAVTSSAGPASTGAS
jgi:hypothetical protein